jgi:putative transposase
MLAEKGKPLGKLRVKVFTIVKPEALLKWHRQLVASKWDFSRQRKAKLGGVGSENRIAHPNINL